MAFPYSSGDVLTAADLNASSGLVLVKTQSVGSGVSSVTLNDAFSSTFDNYRVSISGVTLSSASGNTLSLRMTSSGTQATTNYQYGIARVDIAAGTITAESGQNASAMFVARGVGDKFGTTFDIVMPYISTHTIFLNIGGPEVSTGYTRFGNGLHQTTASYDGFAFYPSIGTMTNGTIRVYGYNNG